MSSPVLNIFSAADLEYLNNLPEVLEAKTRLNSQKMVYFSITLTESLRATLEERLGLDLSTVSSIPLRWIKGDTPPHIDRGASAFEHTYLVYVNDSEAPLSWGQSPIPFRPIPPLSLAKGLYIRRKGLVLSLVF
jgi:hypothetical protein